MRTEKEWLEEIDKGNTINFKQFLNILREQENAEKLDQITWEIDTKDLQKGEG